MSNFFPVALAVNTALGFSFRVMQRIRDELCFPTVSTSMITRSSG